MRQTWLSDRKRSGYGPPWNVFSSRVDASYVARGSERTRLLLLVEIERGCRLADVMRRVGWSSSAYWSQRYRHSAWAHEVDIALARSWRCAAYGRCTPLDGRSQRGAIRRMTFLQGVRSGEVPSAVRKRLDWSAPAYYQARYRHADWAERVDAAARTCLT